MSKKTRFDEIDVDEETLYAAIEEARRTIPVSNRRALLTVFLIIAILASAWMGDKLAPGFRWTLTAALVCVTALAVILAPMMSNDSVRKQHIRRALNKRGFLLCIECGHDLRSLPESIAACPECGTPRATA